MRKILLPLSALAAASALFATAPASAQAAWQQIASRAVNANADRDTLFASGEAGQREIRVCAANFALAIQTLEIRFDDGSSQSVSPSTTLQAGQCSNAIALASSSKAVDSVIIGYTRPQGGAQAPRVRIDAR